MQDKQRFRLTEGSHLNAHDTEDGLLTITIESPTAGTTPGDNLKALLVDTIAEYPGINTTGLREDLNVEALIGADSKQLAAHLNQLEADAQISRIPDPRNSKPHYLPKDLPASLLAPTP